MPRNIQLAGYGALPTTLAGVMIRKRLETAARTREAETEAARQQAMMERQAQQEFAKVQADEAFGRQVQLQDILAKREERALSVDVEREKMRLAASAAEGKRKSAEEGLDRVSKEKIEGIKSVNRLAYLTQKTTEDIKKLKEANTLGIGRDDAKLQGVARLRDLEYEHELALQSGRFDDAKKLETMRLDLQREIAVGVVTTEGGTSVPTLASRTLAAHTAAKTVDQRQNYAESLLKIYDLADPSQAAALELWVRTGDQNAWNGITWKPLPTKDGIPGTTTTWTKTIPKP
jgi:hypothetical protein